MSLLTRFMGREPAKPPQLVQEIIGRTASYVTNFWDRIRSMRSSVDATRPDYAWWDRFRRGKEKGFKFSGLFAKAITVILTSWVMGDAIEARLVETDDYTDELLKRFMKRVHGRLMQMVIDLYGLGDQYIFVNADGSLSIPSPDLVDVEYDELDYRHMMRVTITSQLDKAKVTDVYTADERTITIEWKQSYLKKAMELMGRRPAEKEVYVYQNLIGKIPCIHYANDRSANETHGRPDYEALHHLFSRYDDLMEKMVDGAELMGNPIPTFNGTSQIEAQFEAMQAQTGEEFVNEMGGVQERNQIDWDGNTAIFAGEGGTFTLTHPGNGFTNDIRNTLKSMFYLLAEHIRIPEAVWGLELSSARATAEEQMKTFYMYIWMKRLQLQGEGADTELGVEAHGGLLELCDIWLRMKALTDSRVKVRPVTLKWSNLTEMDAELKFEKTKDAHNKGVITDKTYLDNLDIVEDAEAEVKEAEKQMQTEADRFDADVQNALNEEDELEEAA